MSQVLDPDRHEQLLGDLQQLMIRALDHEHRLVELVNHLEGAESSTGVASQSGVDTASSIERHPDLLRLIRQLCVAAREQRVLTDGIVHQLSNGSQGSIRSNRGRVLVVDDSEDTRDIIGVVLTASGFEVLTATNGLEAVVAAHNVRPAVIVMDVNMPVLNGIEATRLLKAARATRDLPVIAHTAKPDFVDGPLRRLFASVLPKPVAPDTVVATVRRFVT